MCSESLDLAMWCYFFFITVIINLELNLCSLNGKTSRPFLIICTSNNALIITAGDLDGKALTCLFCIGFVIRGDCKSCIWH